MLLEIENTKYDDLSIIKDISKLRVFGEPKAKVYDSLLGDNFFIKFIGYIPAVGGALIKPSLIERLLLSEKKNLRRVFLCEYKGKYWFSLDYGYNPHLDIPEELENK